MHIYISRTWIKTRNHFEFPILKLTQVLNLIRNWLVVVLFDSSMNNWSGRCQHFFLDKSIFEFSDRNWTQIQIFISIRLVLVLFDNLMNNLCERRQYFFLQAPFLNSSYSNWPKCIFSSQSEDSFMEKYNLSTQKRGIFDTLPHPLIKIFKVWVLDKNSSRYPAPTECN